MPIMARFFPANAAESGLLADISTRVSRKLGFGGAPKAGPGGPQVRIVRAGSDSNVLGDVMTGDASKRYSIELYAQAFNLLNHVNAINFSGVQSSPFFGQATSAGAPRRVEIGTRLNF